MFFGVGGLARCGLYDMEVNKSLHNLNYETLGLSKTASPFFRSFFNLNYNF